MYIYDNVIQYKISANIIKTNKCVFANAQNVHCTVGRESSKKVFVTFFLAF